MARIPTLVELQLERARAATTSIVQQRAAADRLRTKITTDTETEQVSRTLQQLMSAKRFPQWLATAALESLVAGASESLAGELSDGQFTLAHEKGEFFVIDHFDADSQRSVRTLSGGETFQASLALALALSEQLATLSAVGGNARLDSIFLNEGFGTLDPDALETVAATLENLAQGERMVGVITHVAALAGGTRGPVPLGQPRQPHLDHRTGRPVSSRDTPVTRRGEPPAMRFAVDSWDPGYGTSFGIDGPPETVTRVVTDVEVATDDWAPIHVTPVEPPRATIFVDGVRRIDARIWIRCGVTTGVRRSGDGGVDGPVRLVRRRGHLLLRGPALMSSSPRSGAGCSPSILTPPVWRPGPGTTR